MEFEITSTKKYNIDCCNDCPFCYCKEDTSVVFDSFDDPNYGEVQTEFDMDYFRNGLYGPKNIKWLLQHHVDFNNMINEGYARLVVEEDSPYKKD